LDATEIPMQIATDNLECRSRRQGPDLVKDNVEIQLLRVRKQRLLSIKVCSPSNAAIAKMWFDHNYFQFLLSFIIAFNKKYLFHTPLEHAKIISSAVDLVASLE